MVEQGPQEASQKASGNLPPGFIYRPDFLSASEEKDLLGRVRGIEFAEIKMHGVVARRRAAHFGFDYAYDSAAIAPGPPFPEFLRSLAKRLAPLAGVEPDRLVEALVTEYPPGAPIGWHRDAPQFGIVAAVSLVSPCRFKFRYGSSGRASATLAVEPRSAYVLSGDARSKWQHAIAPAKALRYSITLRTLRAGDRQSFH